MLRPDSSIPLDLLLVVHMLFYFGVIVCSLGQLLMAMRMALAYRTNPYATARWDLSCCDASMHM